MTDSDSTAQVFREWAQAAMPAPAGGDIVAGITAAVEPTAPAPEPSSDLAADLEALAAQITNDH